MRDLLDAIITTFLALFRAVLFGVGGLCAILIVHSLLLGLPVVAASWGVGLLLVITILK